MKPERKKEIRALVHTIPVLIKAHMVNQAFETEKVIATTFELSTPLLDLIGGKIPPNHIDRIQEVYSDIMYKAFNIGIKSGEVKSKSTEINTALSEDDLNREIEIKMPIYFGVKRDLLSLINEQLGDVLNTVPDIKENIIAQFEHDIDVSYLDGVKEYLHITENPENLVEVSIEEEKAEEEEEQEEQEEKLEPEEEFEVDDSEEEEETEESDEEETEESDEEETEESDEEEEEEPEEKKLGASVKASVDPIDATAITALKVWHKYASKELKDLFKMQASVNYHNLNALMVHDFNNWLVEGNTPELFIPFEKNTKKVDDKAVLQRLEKYTKLLKDNTAEKVLRYTLGLPVKKAQGAVGQDSKRSLTKLEAYTKLLNDPEAERVLRYTLGLPIKNKTTGSVNKIIGSYDPMLLKEKILSIVKNPKDLKIIQAGIDGVETIIVDCIVTGMSKMSETLAVKRICSKLEIKASSFEELEKSALVLTQKLDNEMGLPGDCVFIDIGDDYCLTYSYAAMPSHTSSPSKLPIEDKEQIKCLSSLSKSKTIKDIINVSPKVAAHVNNILSSIRWSKIGIIEGSNKLRASLDDLIAEVFGSDGLEYYQSLK